MAESWDFYFCEVNGEPASIALDLGYGTDPPRIDHPVLLVVRVRLPQGDAPPHLETTAGDPSLERIENLLVAQLQRSCEALHVGRLTAPGMQEYAFYAARKDEFEGLLSWLDRRYPDHAFLYRAEEDPDWNHYFHFLWPTRQEYQWMQDRCSVQGLDSRGDRGEVPRDVDHVLLFPQEQGRRAFAAEVAPLGFRVLEKDRAPGDLPHRLLLRRRDPVLLNHIHEVACALIQRSEAHGGVYDGWHTEVVADSRRPGA